VCLSCLLLLLAVLPAAVVGGQPLTTIDVVNVTMSPAGHCQLSPILPLYYIEQRLDYRLYPRVLCVCVSILTILCFLAVSRHNDSILRHIEASREQRSMRDNVSDIFSAADAMIG
jgi:hypothetical protein